MITKEKPSYKQIDHYPNWMKANSFISSYLCWICEGFDAFEAIAMAVESCGLEPPEESDGEAERMMKLIKEVEDGTYG